MIIRHANNGKMYLYDILDEKKRNEHPFGALMLYSAQNPFLMLL